MGAFEVLLGGLDRRGNCPRIGHQPTSRQQSETEGSPKTEGIVERAIVRALSKDAARRAKEGEVLRGCKKGRLMHIINGSEKRSMEVFGVGRSIVLLVAVASLFGVYVTKQALAGCFAYCVAVDRQIIQNQCGGVINGCPGSCSKEEWQEGFCQSTINPFAGCDPVQRLVPRSLYTTGCVPAGVINPSCQCDGANWQFQRIVLVNQPDCNGYTCLMP